MCVVVLVAATACGYHRDDTVVHLTDPGKCVAVDIAATAETAPLLADTASRFNHSSAARLRAGACAFVRVETVDSAVALRELTKNWPDTTQLGPAPVAWVPGSTMWGELLNARLAAQHRSPLAPPGTPFARTPLVVAMPAPMARALGYPNRPIGWSDLEQLAQPGRGWSAYGHTEWGPFRLGKGNPNWSTTGLDASIALDASPAAARGARVLEQSVVYYADSTRVYFDNWRRLAKTSTASALTYLSAAITDERSVIAYNSGHEPDDVSLTGSATRPALPLVAVYPKDTAVESDNPIIVLDASWASADARAGARLFTTFARQPAAQARVAAAGFRPAIGAARADLVDARNGVDPAAHTHSVAPASPGEIDNTLTRWQANRRRARVLVLVDVSNSMGDPADPSVAHGPTKMALARSALTSAIDELAPDDDIGLRIFTTQLANPVSPDWSDVVPSGPLAARRPALRRAITALSPQVGSPLYAATRAAYDAVGRGADPQRIDAVVVLTDGYNEDEHDTDLHGLLTHLTSHPDIRVFTIAYGAGADVTTLKKIAQATNAWDYDATETRDLADVLPRALASF